MRRKWLLLAWLVSCTPLEEEPAAAVDPDPRALYAEHLAGRQYFNPWPPPHERSVLQLLRWWLSPGRYEKGEPRLPVVPNDGSSLRRPSPAPEITWVGHSTFAIHEGTDVVLTDPHFSPRALFPRRQVPPGLPIEAIPPDAFAVISHSHYDHLDARSVEQLPRSVRWFVPLGLGGFFRDRGREVVELDWWQSAQRGRWTITCLPAQHWSLRIGQRDNTTLWCSWLLDSGEHRYYFAGDTGYFHGFAEFAKRFGPIDVALLPIGAYEPRWFMRYQHMDPAEAYRAFGDLRASYMLPMHWGTFDLTDEPLDLPPRALREVIEREGGNPARAPVLAIGETWTLPGRQGPADRSWDRAGAAAAPGSPPAQAQPHAPASSRSATEAARRAPGPR